MSPGRPSHQGPALREYLDARRREVDEALTRWLPSAPRCPAVMADAVSYSIRAGGKRLRPILTLAAAEAAGARGEPPITPVEARALALPAACALELVHTYSLVHDDLPAMDNDVLRRGQPTLHVVHGDGLAILAGDGLLTEAFGLMAREPTDGAGALASRKLRAIARVAEAAGLHGMVGGQAIDLQLSGQTGSVPPDRATPDLGVLQDMHARKTGALIRAAAVAGALMVGARDDIVSALDAYAAGLGLAFQIIDDVLDVEGQTAALGKTAGKDAAAGKLTYPALVGLDRSRALAREAVTRAEEALARVSLDAEHLGGIARWVVERSG
jgi:geranylgeranyl diphosphate synthase type II